MKKFATAISLAAIAALALMAVVGASAASAKVCSKSGTGAACASGHGNVMGAGQKLVASLSTPSVATLTSGFIRVTCGESTVEGEITNGETGTGDITKMTFADCHSNVNTNSGSCTASTSASTSNKWPASVKTGTAPNGTMTVENITGTFVCNVPFLGNVTCNYIASSATVTVNGGEPATVVASEVPLEKQAGSGGSCSSTAKWDGTYKVTTPTSLYLT
jgi:hypothetical protein